MKVTVSFGDVRVIVPCGDGSLLVSDLIEKSKVRYRKASRKPLDHWIHVHTLKTANDDGILDPDDQLIDVADDREQIIAYFEEQRAPSLPHNGGDGTSASSAGTASPDIFHGGDLQEKAFRPMYSSRNHQNDVLITPNDLTLGTNLTVRRGSEPSLNQIGTSDENQGGNNTLPKNKTSRWSAIASIEDSPGPSNDAREAVYSDSEMSEERPPSNLRRIGEEGELSTFARDSARKSLGNMPGMYKWLDAHERLEDNYHQFHDMRKEPLGGHGYQNGDTVQPADDKGYVIVMKNECGPLGIHVVPHYDDEARESGLIVQGIEPGGRIHRDGQLAVQDQIIEINETPLMDVSFTKAQEVFKGALQSDEIRLKVIKHKLNAVKPPDKKPSKQPPPTPPKPNLKKLNLSIPKEKDKNDNITNSAMVPTQPQTPPGGEVPYRLSERPPSPKTHPSSPNQAPPPIPSRAPETTLSGGTSDRQLVTNTRKIGKKIPIQLAKGADGLGFSITTRDNPAGGNAPIYVKNILPKGAAITDGRLKPGDRLLEVNSIDLSDKSQTDAVGLLRNAKLGSFVELLVSRQVVEDRFSVPRKLTRDQGIETDDEQPTRETIRLDIPLNETGSAGLGVSVKGKTQKREGIAGTIDVGIFVKAVMHGGAASKLNSEEDGQLRVNDQLISVNGQSLIGKTNAASMELLRRSMQTEGPVPGYIQLVVSRKIGAPTPTPEQGGLFSFEHLGFDNKSPTDMDHNTSEEERTFKTIHAQSNSVSNSRDLAHSSEQSSRGRHFNDCVTLNAKNEESVLIEEDSYVARGRPRPHSTIGFVRPTPPDTPSSGSSHEEDGDRPRRRKPSDMTMDDSMVLFSREGFGRQSMSEKRRGHIDAKQMDFYQKLKSEKGKENETVRVDRVSPPTVQVKRDTADILPPHPWMWRHYTMKEPPPSYNTLPIRRTNHPAYVEVTASLDRRYKHLNLTPGLADAHNDVKVSVPEDIGPTLGMKKSSSLESLQAMVKEVVDEEEDAMMWHGPSAVVRGRGCNESFRAAVDRSYDGPHVTVDQMESLAEEDSEIASNHGRKSATNSARSSMSFEGPSEITISLKAAKSKAPKEKEKKGGIFKGLFKFGQKRKTIEITRPPSKTRSHSPGPKGKAPDPPPARQENLDQHKARVAAQEEQDRIQEHYRRLKEKQHQIDQHQPQYGHHTQRDIELSAQTREERIQQLRAEHQRKHQERQGRYPHEDKEEEYEEEMQENLDDELMEDQKWGLYSEITPQLSGSSSVQSHQRFTNSAHSQQPLPSSNMHSQQPLQSSNMHSQHRLQSSTGLQSQQRLSSSSSVQSQPQIYDGRPRKTPPDGRSYNNYQTFDEIDENKERNDHYRDQYLKYQEVLHAQQMQQIRMEQQRQQQIAGKYGAHNGCEKPRSATPVNALGYMSHKKQLMGSLSASHADESAGNIHFDYDDPRHAYQEPQYAVVQRRNKQPGPAKV
ncbi:partitioning defective 3 homolog B-like isoform X2 [Lineus longissimus]|uniref:partitioning defective 3 homolog B-like isoform X2 n=1 Tax=Lineus longissimus TaxID=88925 RepID=UPI00315DBBCF